MTEEAEEKTAYADTSAVGLIWNRDTGIECYEEEYLLKEWFKLLGRFKNFKSFTTQTVCFSVYAVQNGSLNGS